jgi:YhcH/YjgK/YiaL family protein
MILSHISDSSRYESLHPLFKQVFDYIKANDLTKVPAERIVLDGDKLFINVADARLIPAETQKLEVHQKYIDIHFPLSGKEIVGWKHLSNLGTSEAPFDTDNDFALYAEEPTTYFTVMPGEFYIVYPEDAHAPIIGEGTLRKLIVKVMID